MDFTIPSKLLNQAFQTHDINHWPDKSNHSLMHSGPFEKLGSNDYSSH